MKETTAKEAWIAAAVCFVAASLMAGAGMLWVAGAMLLCTAGFVRRAVSKTTRKE